MPQHKSCKKRLKTSAKERIRNNAVRTFLKKTIKDARTKLAANEAIDLNELYTSIDKVWAKGILPKKRAARLKSRMAKASARTGAKSN